MSIPNTNPADVTTLLEESLVVTCLRAGTNIARTKTRRLIQPYTVIGQSAAMQVELEAPNQTPVTVAPKGGYILPEDVPYRVTPTHDIAAPYHWSHFQFKLLGELDLFLFIQSPHALPVSTGNRIARINKALAHTFTTLPPGSLPLTHPAAADRSIIQTIALRRLLCAQMLSLVIKHCPPRPEAFATLDKITRLLPVLKFMRDQMARPIFRDELAKLTDLSPSRFHALFLDATGQSPLEYLTRLRLKRAQELLLSTAAPVQDIANRVGFRDPFHFTRTFKRLSGQSPRAYRQTVQNQMRQNTT
jgi:AraC-like DNA-binding protein